MRPRRHRILLPSTALLAAALLAGCVPTAPEPPADTPTAATPTPTTTPSATPEPAPTEEIIPFSIGCDVLLPPAALYEIDPNLGMLGPITPDAGTPAAAVVAAGGVACRWAHESSGAMLDIAVAQLPPTAATALKNRLVMESNSVPTYEVEGYFRVAGTGGEADAFPDPYWVSAVSPAFLEPGDAAPFMAAVIAALR